MTTAPSVIRGCNNQPGYKQTSVRRIAMPIISQIVPIKTNSLKHFIKHNYHDAPSPSRPSSASSRCRHQRRAPSRHEPIISSRELAIATTPTPLLRCRPNHPDKVLLATVQPFVNHARRKEATRPAAEPCASFRNCQTPNAPQSATRPFIVAIRDSKYVFVCLVSHLIAVISPMKT